MTSNSFSSMSNLDAFKEQGDVIWNIANLLRACEVSTVCVQVPV